MITNLTPTTTTATALSQSFEYSSIKNLSDIENPIEFIISNYEHARNYLQKTKDILMSSKNFYCFVYNKIEELDNESFQFEMSRGVTYQMAKTNIDNQIRELAYINSLYIYIESL